MLEGSQALDGRSRSMYDPDELDEEQRERALKNKLNEVFKKFCKDVEHTAEKAGYSIQFDAPYRELAFSGNPNKEMVTLQPTVNCLVNLTEQPAFVISLDDIEHVHFERVLFSGKNFDCVIIFKDLKRPVAQINMIPMQDLDLIKV